MKICLDFIRINPDHFLVLSEKQLGNRMTTTENYFALLTAAAFSLVFYENLSRYYVSFTIYM